MRRPSLKPVKPVLTGLVKTVCPNPNVSITAVPPKITFGCR